MITPDEYTHPHGGIDALDRARVALEGIARALVGPPSVSFDHIAAADVRRASLHAVDRRVFKAQ